MPEAAIIGNTSWGLTLGILLARKNINVGLLTRTEQEACELIKSRLRSNGLHHYPTPDGEFLSNFIVTHQPQEAMAGVATVILPVTSQTMRQNVREIRAFLDENMIIVSAAKGFEVNTNLRMTQVIASEIAFSLHGNIGVISGPNLAREIMQGLPAATVAASENATVSRKIQRLFTTPNLCVFTHSDVIGVELGGALKNIIALGAGMADGLGYGDNAKAAFITRGLTEISALGVAMGASPLTFSGLAGLGDLIATCTSPLSRNHYMGVELTRGRSVQEIMDGMEGVSEGVYTTKVAWTLARQRGLEMPITEKIYRVLYEGLSPREAASELMQAPVEHELTGRKWELFSFLRRRRYS